MWFKSDPSIFLVFNLVLNYIEVLSSVFPHPEISYQILENT